MFCEWEDAVLVLRNVGTMWYVVHPKQCARVFHDTEEAEAFVAETRESYKNPLAKVVAVDVEGFEMVNNPFRPVTPTSRFERF